MAIIRIDCDTQQGRVEEPLPGRNSFTKHSQPNRRRGTLRPGGTLSFMKTANRILLILLAVATLSHAGPYINPGLMSIPTAYTIPHTALKLHYSGSFFLGHAPTDPNVEDYMDFSLSGGISFWDMGLELTFAALDFESNAYVGSAELNFIPETVKFPAVSIGVRNVGYDHVTSFGVLGVEGGASNYYPPDYEPQWYDQVSAYVVFSKDLYPAIAVPLRGHIGLGTGVFQGRYDSLYTTSLGWRGVFGAIEYQIRYDLSVALETDGRSMNFGVLYNLPWWGMEVGLSLNKLEMLFYSEEEASTDGVWDEYDQIDLGVHFGVQFGPFIGSSEEKKQELIRERIDRGWDQLREIQTRRQEMQQRLADMRERIAAENEGRDDE